MDNAPEENLSSVIQKTLVEPVQNKFKSITTELDNQKKELSTLKAENKMLKIIIVIIALIALTNTVFQFIGK